MFIDGIMNQINYKTVSVEYLLPFLDKQKDTAMIFQQDGAPCHTAKTIKTFFTENDIEILDWVHKSQI